MAGFVFGLEGFNGVGKSTVLRELLFALRSIYGNDKIVSVGFPGHTALGLVIRQIVLDREIEIAPLGEFYLFAVDNVATWNDITRLVRQDYIVITDCSWLSSLAFQGEGLGVDKELIVRNSLLIAKYNRVYILDAPYSVIQERTQNKQLDRIESRTPAQLQRIHRFYSNLKFIDCFVDIKHIDADRELQMIVTEILIDIRKIMKK